jgi:hypothetical protein
LALWQRAIALVQFPVVHTSLGSAEYEKHAVETFDDALASIRRQKPEYAAIVAAFHAAARERNS